MFRPKRQHPHEEFNLMIICFKLEEGHQPNIGRLVTS